MTGSSAFDFNGDGSVEIIYRDSDTLRIYNGGDGKILYEIATPSGTGIDYPVVADLTANGHAKIIVTAGGSSGIPPSECGIKVYSAPEDDWIGTRSLWNQYAYHVTNVGDMGELSGFDQDKIWSKYVSSKYLLGFRNNLPLRPRKSSCP